MKQHWILILGLTFLLTGCPGIPPGSGTLVFKIDTSIQPIVPSIPGLDGAGPERPLGRLRSPGGTALDFTLGELLVATDDSAKLNAFLSRWKGSVLQQVDFSEKGLTGVPKLYVVKVDPSAADPSGLPRNLLSLAPGVTGESKVSSEQTLKLLAVATQEAAQQGLAVGLNLLFQGQDAGSGLTQEASSGPSGYMKDACQWPYMNKGSNQDFGVCAAWQLLAQNGKLSNKVKVMVMDGGFVPNPDFPAGTQIFPSNAWKIINPDPSRCNANKNDPGCPWHGTDVVTAMAGVPDNGFGAAGPAGPVADLMVVQSPALDLWGILKYLFNTLPAALSEHPKIINISATLKVPWEWGWAVKQFVDEPVKSLRKGGTLVFAAAGNLGEDVDTKYAPLNNEDRIYLPCEADDAICVGGLSWNSNARAPSSDYGEEQRRRQNGYDDPKKQDNSVDIYGPYTIYGGPEPDNNANINLSDPARKISGTSFASPFVAGVAALVWAANPNLSADDVYRILLETAKPTPVLTGFNNDGLRVDAFAAVKKALGITNATPTITVLRPKQNDSFDIGSPLGVDFEAQVSDIEDGVSCCKVTWTSLKDGFLGEGKKINFLFQNLGTRLITATVEDSQGASSSVNFAINITNSGPTAKILKPTNGAQFAQGLSYNDALEAQTWIANPNLTYSYTWTSSDGSDNFPKTGAKPAGVVFGNLGTRTLTLTVSDNLGGQSQASVTVGVVDKGINFVAPPNEAQIPGLLSGPNIFVNIEVKPSAPQGRVYKLVWQGDAQGCAEEAITLYWNPQVLPPPNTKDVWGEWDTSKNSQQCFGVGKSGYLRLYVNDPNVSAQTGQVHLNWTPPPN